MLPIRGTRIYFLPFTIQHFLPSEVQIAIRERVLLNPVLGDSVVQVRPRAAAGAADACQYRERFPGRNSLFLPRGGKPPSREA